MAHRILIVDDSRVARLALRAMLDRPTEGLEVVDVASSAAEVHESAARVQPDLVVMDVELAGEDGVQLCEELLGRIRTRIVIVTAVAPRDPALHFRALAAGALDVLAKPRGDAAGAAERASFVRAIRALAAVPTLRRLKNVPAAAERPTEPATARTEFARCTEPARLPFSETGVPRRFARVLIGVSTGGPPLLEAILRQVPVPMPVPVLVVQHIAAGFGEGFAKWLGTSTGHTVRYCRTSGPIDPGVVYVANDEQHLQLIGPQFVRVGPSVLKRIPTPSVDELFETAANHDPTRTLAILLSGMGSDGAIGLERLRDVGAFTVAQSPASCVVASMPASAIERGAAMRVLDPVAIAALLGDLGSAACGRVAAG